MSPLAASDTKTWPLSRRTTPLQHKIANGSCFRYWSLTGGLKTIAGSNLRGEKIGISPSIKSIEPLEAELRRFVTRKTPLRFTPSGRRFTPLISLALSHSCRDAHVSSLSGTEVNKYASFDHRYNGSAYRFHRLHSPAENSAMDSLPGQIHEQKTAVEEGPSKSDGGAGLKLAFLFQGAA